MTEAEIKALIQQELPNIIAQDIFIRDFILRTVSNYYSPKQETDSKFDRILAQLERDREEQARKWDENNRKFDEFIQEQARKWEDNNRKWDEFTQEQNRKWDEQNRKWEDNNRKWDEFTQEQNRKWDEQNRKWEDNNRKWDEFTQEQARKWDEQNRKWDEQNRKWEENNKKLDKMQQQIDQSLAEIKKANKRYDSTIGALGSRWGLYSEASFRNGLKGILEDSFGVEVININEYDHDGEVFGRPDQVEIDVIIKNGLIILCEIKSNIDKAGMYIFDRKVAFYEKHHNRTVNRKIVISPMVDPRALPVAENLGIEIYSYAEDIENL